MNRIGFKKRGKHIFYLFALLCSGLMLANISFAGTDPVSATVTQSLPSPTVIGNAYPVTVQFRNNYPFTLNQINLQTNINTQLAQNHAQVKDTNTCQNISSGESCTITTSVPLIDSGTNVLDMSMRYFGNRVKLPGKTTTTSLEPMTAYATSAAGDIISSSDGITWSKISNMPVSSVLEGLTYNGQQWVAVGIDNTTGQGAIFTSSDAITWTQQTVPTSPTTTSDLYDAAWDGTQWVVVGSGEDFTKGVILTSPDGTTWTQQSVPANVKFLQGIATNNHLWVAVGWDDIDSTTVVLTSSDGTTWTRQTDVPNVKIQADVVWNGSIWASAGRDLTYNNAAIITSPDGIHWTQHNTGISTDTFWFFGLAWNGNEWLAVGQGDAGLPTPQGQIYTSPDATTWTERSLPSGSDANVLFSAKWNGVRWIVVGAEAEIAKEYPFIFTSTDDETWTERTAPVGTVGLTEIAVK